MKQKETPAVIPSMEDIIAYLNETPHATSKRDIARHFGVKGEARAKLRDMVRSLKKQGALVRERRGRRLRPAGQLPERLIVEITGTDSMGDLIARPTEWLHDKNPPQIVIVKDKLNPPAGVGDVVQAQIKSVGQELYEGTALRRVTAGGNNMIGIYENGLVYSVDRRLKHGFILDEAPRDIQNKDIIIATIPLIRTRDPHARFIKKITTADTPFAATIMAIYMHNLPVMFAVDTEKQAQKVKIPKADTKRVDLRTVPFVTIDGADARDFDDAVWAEPDTDTGGWHVMIGIADVAWYVRSGTPLDSDAYLRGNSTYFPDRVLPMLPFELSNGVCSLKPNEPRAGMICEVWLDKNGYKTKHRFRRALIQSVRRLTYDEVQNALDNKRPIAGLEKEIKHLHDVYTALKKRRKARGVLEIDVPEEQVVLDKNGQVKAIQTRHQTTSMQLIEELMILANVAAAETLEQAGVPTMYRVHDRPSAEKIATLNAFLNAVHLAPKRTLGEASTPADFNAVLVKADKSDKDFAVNEFMLRSQSQASYSPENIGHFGLALMHYAHFTSPIRRYADIMVHRALISALDLGEGGLTDIDREKFEDIARHISNTERQSATAERDAVDRYIAGFLENKIGKPFHARISSVTKFGLFARLETYGTDGFVPMHALTGDFYEYDEDTQQLVGRSTGKTYQVGDPLHVRLAQADLVTGSLTFHLISKK